MKRLIKYIMANTKSIKSKRPAKSVLGQKKEVEEVKAVVTEEMVEDLKENQGEDFVAKLEEVLTEGSKESADEVKVEEIPEVPEQPEQPEESEEPVMEEEKVEDVPVVKTLADLNATEYKLWQRTGKMPQ
jgi:hypothetical protein